MYWLTSEKFGIVFEEFQIQRRILCGVIGRILFKRASRTFQPNVAAVADALDAKDPLSCLLGFGRGLEIYAYMVSNNGSMGNKFLDCNISYINGREDGRNL